MKVCTKCKVVKQNSSFYADKRTLSGLQSNCKTCIKTFNKLKERTEYGVISRIYAGQLISCKKRCYNMPEYTRSELTDWLYKKTNFKSLFDNWVESGFDTYLKPSIDRIDDYKSYSFDNIRLVTWEKNMQKAYKDRRNGINTKNCLHISQLNLDGTLVKTYYSLSSAARSTGIRMSGIHKALYKDDNVFSGFIWHLIKKENSNG